MNVVNVLFIAVGLAMDAFAVSICSGVIIKKRKFKHALRFGLMFGGFQALMPILGWSAGVSFQSYVAAIDHWIVFGLLFFIGFKMIKDSFAIEEKENTASDLSWMVLFCLAIATSIDALAVGLGFAFLEVRIIYPSVIIGLTAFLFSFAGVYIGSKIGNLFEKRIEIMGGLVLIGIGVKILLEHTLLQ